VRGITPSQTVGPFLKIGLERDELQYLVREDADGAIKILGHVYDGEGKPVPDAMIEIWQANIHGKYAHPDDSSESAIIEGFSGFGRSCTDKDGKFFFVTVKPGRVSGRGNTLQAPHLAVNVFARGMLKHQVTRIYFEDEIESNSEDPILNSIVEKADRNTLLAKISQSEKNNFVYSFDIHLQGEGETVFFEV
tara:strand:- start:537 stop:1112 length:576 start_codon:yes stop_codon:yes gene_type:complete